MLENLHLAAIVKKTGTIRLLRIPLHQRLQGKLAESWHEQYTTFTGDVQEIDFDAGYKPEQHERFRIQDYELPEWLVGKDSLSVPYLDTINNNDVVLDAIQGIIAFARDSQGAELMLFQNFSRSHVIKPGYILLLEKDTYTTMKKPALTLDTKLSAVYLAADKKLLFHSFRTVNTFLPLTDFYEEASEREIRSILQHERLYPEDADALATGANQWSRKRFAMLRDSRVLDEYTAQQIADQSKGYAVNIRLKGDQIVFPADRAEAKRLLQFLNEELFRGAITETLYETNSKREAD
ncbi:MAG: hypothetical protein F4Y00_09415 [Bacteroidetes bacterium SB0662_bin_6]|nr:hypothetical protein [Bacteroidetes bacterium SB0668_bin_1]MYE05172.1 hypothetical protein [Bacteroidetes bacterium SB0662_bin_6]